MSASPGSPQRLHLLRYAYVADVVERRAPYREAHLALLRRWQADGRLLLAGAVGDPPEGALFVLRVDGPQEVERLVADDPYVEAGIVTAWDVEPWTVVVGEA